MKAVPRSCTGVMTSPTNGAENRSRQRFEMHDNCCAKRSDTDSGQEHKQDRGGRGETQRRETRPAHARLRHGAGVASERRRDEYAGRQQHRVPGGEPRIGADQIIARHQQDAGTAAGRADRIDHAEECEPGRMRIDQECQPEEGDRSTKDSFPAQRLKPEQRSGDAGQKRIGEMGENRGRHVDRLDRLEQAENQPRKNNADD